MVHLRLSDQHFYCRLRCDLYQMLNGNHLRQKSLSVKLNPVDNGVPVRDKHCFIQTMTFPNSLINTLRRKQNGHKFPDDISKRIFLNENICISTIGSDNDLAPSSREAIIWTIDVNLRTYICVNRTNAHWSTSSFAVIKYCVCCFLAQCYHLIHYWFIDNLPFRNIVPWNSNQGPALLTQKGF